MNNYTIQTWLLMFFIYSFFGWIWEVLYVSFKNRHWTNRGFLFGPYLPIYGFGAIIILFTTLPFKENLVSLYFVGTFSATILELITGYIMEITFHTRYWDYSYKKYHYKGYICLGSTIAWGFFAIILVEFVNIPIEAFVLSINNNLTDFLAMVGIVIFTTDVTKSTKNALNLKKLLKTLKENNSVVSDIILLFENANEKLSENGIELLDSISGLKEYISNSKDETFDKLLERQKTIQFRVHERLVILSTKFKEEYSNNLDNMKANKLLNEISNFKEKILTKESSIKTFDLDEYNGAFKQLKRNPSASSKKLKDEIEKLKSLK